MNDMNKAFSKLTIKKGLGAGGCNTNKLGLAFEEKTNNELTMNLLGYSKTIIDKSSKAKRNYMYSKDFVDKKITYVCQSGLKKYMSVNYNIKLFRCPDEAYIIEKEDNVKILKILEKKEQIKEGSVETKLWASPSLKREYELMLNNHFKVEYALCVNKFLEDKLLSNHRKYNLLHDILTENEIKILFGERVDYFDNLGDWIMSN